MEKGKTMMDCRMENRQNNIHNLKTINSQMDESSLYYNSTRTNNNEYELELVLVLAE